jgi:hypothetical protein
MTGEIPQSTALAEASLEDSFTELFSRDPEKQSRQDRDKIVAGLREQRERLAAAELAGAKTPRAKKAVSLDKPVIGESLEDLGL